MSSAVSVLASTQNQFASNSGGVTPPQLVVSPINSTQIVSSETKEYTILPGQSGTIFTIPALTTQGNVTVNITLPLPATVPGFNCKFVLTAAKVGTQVINIIAASNTAFHPISLRNANAFTASAVCRGVSFLTAVASAAGSSVEVSSDGFRYSCSARSTAADGVGGLADLP
jgi:hypothetical protein